MNDEIYVDVNKAVMMLMRYDFSNNVRIHCSYLSHPNKYVDARRKMMSMVMNEYEIKMIPPLINKQTFGFILNAKCMNALYT